jgi:hypothetical protein
VYTGMHFYLPALDHIAIAKKSTGQISTSMFDMYVDGTLIAAKTSAGTGTQNLGTAVGVSVWYGFQWR